MRGLLVLGPVAAVVRRARMVGGAGRAAVRLSAEGEVDGDEYLLLAVVDIGGSQDVPDEIRMEVPVVVEDAGADVKRLGGDAQGLGDLLEDLGRWLPQAPLDLAQVWVGDAGDLRQAPEREAGVLPPGLDELAEVGPAVGDLFQGESSSLSPGSPWVTTLWSSSRASACAAPDL